MTVPRASSDAPAKKDPRSSSLSAYEGLTLEAVRKGRWGGELAQFWRAIATEGRPAGIGGDGRETP
jgi:hypothetical protein